MKIALQKSPIPRTHAFLIKKLEEPSFDPTWHFHPEYQLFLVLEGRGTRFIGDNITTFRAGDLTLTGPNLPHLWKSDASQSSTGIVVYFTKELLGKTLLQKEESIKINQLLEKSQSGLNIFGKTALDIQESLINLPNCQGFDRVLKMLNILHILSESQELETVANPAYTNSLKSGDTERMNKVYAYVMSNFRKKIRIAEVATLTNMTTTSFSRYFKLHANKPFSEFISELRIGYACKILIEEKVGIADACYMSGFQTLSNFNRQFKKITKRTPRAYRKEYEMT